MTRKEHPYQKELIYIFRGLDPKAQGIILEELKIYNDSSADTIEGVITNVRTIKVLQMLIKICKLRQEPNSQIQYKSPVP